MQYPRAKARSILLQLANPSLKAGAKSENLSKRALAHKKFSIRRRAH